MILWPRHRSLPYERSIPKRDAARECGLRNPELDSLVSRAVSNKKVDRGTYSLSADVRSKANVAVIGHIRDMSEPTDEVFEKRRETTSPAHCRRKTRSKEESRVP